MSVPRLEILPGLWLDARRALWFAAQRLLVVADLHWGYAAAHRATGNLLPLWGDDEIAARLNHLVADYAPAEMLWLGDSLHALPGRAAAEDFLRTTSTPITILSGNHDVKWPRAADATLVRAGLFFHHGDRPVPPLTAGTIEIIGHHHPALLWRDYTGTRLKLPALIASPSRLILPAFSPWAAGTPWNDRLSPGDILWAVSPKRIFPVTPTQLNKSSVSS
ncbi:metallophosphoesterase [Horticoccus luteus]|uniref:Metallophosphoesterase n=1 Tax=Horticoccus luteus TaxID=2862869 RepID=A0A8F9TW14_9BACT|nr:metallophosphoesterase [Horticoccus luteus]QYM80130.1 metallophosphoesterase [Horticoccus luteus]